MSSKVARQTRARQAEIAAIADDDALARRVRATRRTQRVAEAELFFLAVEVARRGPVDESCGQFGCRTNPEFRVGFCDVATSWFSVVAGFSNDAAEGFLLEALEVAERLPRLYERVLDGRTRPHTARLVAEQTLMLSDEAARFVDAQVAAAGVIRGRYAIKALVREAMIAHMPAEYAALQEVEADPRKADVWVGTDGRGRVDAVLDAFSAVKLEDTLQYGAAQLKAAGSQEVLDTRRSFAFSDLIEAAYRPGHEQGTFDLTAGQDCAAGESSDADGERDRATVDASENTTGEEHVGGASQSEVGRPRWSGRGVPPPRVSLFVHVNASAFWPDGNPGAGPIDPDYVASRQDREPVRLEGPGLPPGVRISAAELRALFTRPSCWPGCTPDGSCDCSPGGSSASGAGCRSGSSQVGGCVPEPPRITVRPVIDLEQEHSVEGYAAGDVIKEHLALRDGTCVFPFCTRTARGCDADHMTPWRTDEAGDPVGGPTCTCNLASLCRTHHRWKTHAHQIRHGGPGGAPPGLRETWSYEMVAPGVYYWTSPMGGRFLRTRTGTIDVTDDARCRRDAASVANAPGDHRR